MEVYYENDESIIKGSIDNNTINKCTCIGVIYINGYWNKSASNNSYRNFTISRITNWSNIWVSKRTKKVQIIKYGLHQVGSIF